MRESISPELVAGSMSDQQNAGPSTSWEGAPNPLSLAKSKLSSFLLLVLSLSLAIIVIDSMIVIAALPQIKADFQISFKDLEWITSLYALVFGSLILTWGKLSDQFGRKRPGVGDSVETLDDLRRWNLALDMLT